MMERQTADDVIYNALVEAARTGKRCPTNNELAGLIGASSVATPVRILARLSRAGKVVVTSGHNQRVVDIPAYQIGTAGVLPQPHWRELRGQALATHAPRVLGEAPPKPAPRRTYVSRDPDPVQSMRRGPRLTAEEIEARVVSRDPCPRCGIRGDIGCKHMRSSGG